MATLELTAVTDGVYLARGRDVNWTLLVDGHDVTLIDAGYPRYVGAVVESLARIGRRPEDVRAILLTHAHIDHIGGAVPLAAAYGTPVLASPTEVAHAHRDYLQQVAPLAIAHNILRPAVAAWTVRVVRAGGLESGEVPSTRSFELDPDHAKGEPLDLPGRPLPVDTAGHTAGHTSFFLPSSGSVITGDALVTGHALSTTTGPQLLPHMFSHDPTTENAVLDVFAELDADLLLPGHGPACRMPIATAITHARTAHKAANSPR